VKENGSKNIIYTDESGFLEEIYNPYSWTKRGEKIYGEKQGKRSKRSNLIMAQKGKKWLAPFIFTGSCTAALVEKWMEKHLFKELEVPSLIIMDNAPFHRKKHLHAVAKKHNHKILFLPPYSPDFNPIEKSFGWLKRKRLYDKNNPTLEELIMSYY
jgi:transposase